MSKKNTTAELTILLILIIVSFFLWDTYFVYPIKLFVVMLHELSHAIAAFLTGGKIISMNIGFNLGGKCEAEGGNVFIISAAGYLGSLLFGLVFFISPNNVKHGKWIVISVCSLIIIMSLFTATNGLFILLAFISSGIMITCAFYSRIPMVAILMRALGLLSCIYVLFDIKEDVLQRTDSVSDASVLANILNVSTYLVGIVWIIVSLMGIIFAIKLSYKKKSYKKQPNLPAL
jgi:hypothetical protein